MKRWGWLAALAATAAFAATALAGERGTEQEAEAMVKNAIKYYKAVGRDKALAEFSKKEGRFADRDLYVTVYKQDGECVANINSRVVGRNMMDMRDVDGHYFVRERLEASRTQPSGWQDFKFFNPLTKKVEPKRQYWELHDGLVFATGAYKGG
jgi:cytochrome c